MELSPERKLLLACAPAKLCDQDRSRIAQLASRDLDWNQITDVAYTHGIAPLIYHHLVQAAVVSLVPLEPVRKLEKAYYGTAASNLLLYNELRSVLLSLRNELEVIVLKGAALAEVVYPHRALRPMSDIDLLVRKKDIEEAEAILMKLGYRVEAQTKQRQIKEHYHLVFTKPGCANIELHWHINRPSSPFRIDIDSLWRRSDRVKIAGVDARLFSPEDLVLYLCQHFWKHEYIGGVRPLCDIAAVIAYYGGKIEWKEVTARSSQWQMNACTYLGLWLAKNLLDARVPKRVLDDLRPPDFTDEVVCWAMQSVLGHGECPQVFGDLLKLFWKGYSAQERWTVLRRAMSRHTVAAYKQDTSASENACIYYPLRMKRLFTQYAPTVFGLLGGDQKIRAAADREDNQRRLAKWLSEAAANR